MNSDIPQGANLPVGMVIRRAELPDVPAIVALVESCYRGDASRRGWTTEADLLDGQRTDADEVRTLITAKDSAVLVLAEADILGCCHVTRGENGGYFGMFAIQPSRQAGGLGRILLAAVESYAATAFRARSMELHVISQRTELISWYERLGYAMTGESSPFPYGNERFGLPLRGDLVFLTMKKEIPR